MEMETETDKTGGSEGKRITEVAVQGDGETNQEAIRISTTQVGSSLLARLAVANHTPEELALGYLRYEAVRRMNPRTFGELHRRNLSGSFFDDLVDEILSKRGLTCV